MNKIIINGTELTQEQANLVEAAILTSFLNMPKQSQLVHLNNCEKIVKLFEDREQKEPPNQLFKNTFDYGKQKGN